MAATPRHLALSGLILVLATVAMANVKLSGLRIQVTEGDRILHNIWSESATLAEGGRMVEAVALTLSANEGTTQTLRSFAPRAFVYVSNHHDAPEEPEPAPDLPTIRHYADDFPREAREGDVLLLGEGTRIMSFVGEDATLDSERLIWSSRYDRLLIPDPFIQTNRTPNGAVTIVGEALSVDNDFEEWVYFALPGSDVVMEFTADAAPQSERP